MLQEKFNFRKILNLDVQTESGSDQVLKTGYGSDQILKTGSGSDFSALPSHDAGTYIGLFRAFEI